MGGRATDRRIPAGPAGHARPARHSRKTVRARERDRHTARRLRTRGDERDAGAGARVGVLRDRQIIGGERAAQGARAAARTVCVGEVRSIQTRHPVYDAGAGVSEPRSVSSRQERRRAEWLARPLVEALGPNGPLMIDLVPELKLIIGDQPPVPQLAPQDARRRFQLGFRRFIGVFARQEHPLALFLDDLQWLDAATLDLLEDLLTPPGVPHLMLIGAYRDNEVTAAHPLTRKLEANPDRGSERAGD